MVQRRQPKIEIDDLQPDGTCRGYHASWQEGTLTAHAWLNPIQDQPANGFTLEYTCNHVQLNRRISEKQIDIGTTLISKVRELMLGQMVRAGWVEIGRDAKKRPIWQHMSRFAKQPVSSRPGREDGLAKARRELERTIAEHQANVQGARTPSLQPVSNEQVTVTLDDFTISPYLSGEARRNYKAKAVQGDVQAIVAFLPYRHAAYPGAYHLQTGVDCAPFVPGVALTEGQQRRALALLPELLAQVERALVVAGWSVRWQSPEGQALWTWKDWRERYLGGEGTQSAQKVDQVPSGGPTVVIDDLTLPPITPAMRARFESPRVYRAEAVQGDVKAVIQIRPYKDPSYPGGYLLDEQIDRVDTFAPGAMGKRQKERGQALLTELRGRVHARLLTAGWVKRWTTEGGVTLWFYTRPLEDPASAQVSRKPSTPAPAAPTRVLTILPKEGRQGYQRTIAAQPVLFTCSRCGQETTKVQFPGRTPRYCETCAPIVTREQTRARVQRLRRMRRADTSVPG